jgi:hypothetical protein
MPQISVTQGTLESRRLSYTPDDGFAFLPHFNSGSKASNFYRMLLNLHEGEQVSMNGAKVRRTVNGFWTVSFPRGKRTPGSRDYYEARQAAFVVADGRHRYRDWF